MKPSRNAARRFTPLVSIALASGLFGTLLVSTSAQAATAHGLIFYTFKEGGLEHWSARADRNSSPADYSLLEEPKCAHVVMHSNGDFTFQFA